MSYFDDVMQYQQFSLFSYNQETTFKDQFIMPSLVQEVTYRINLL